MGISLVSWIGSWLLSALTIAIIAAVIDESSYRELENHQKVGFFLFFILPTLIEGFSFYLLDKPVFYGL